MQLVQMLLICAISFQQNGLLLCDWNWHSLTLSEMIFEDVTGHADVRNAPHAGRLAIGLGVLKADICAALSKLRLCTKNGNWLLR